MKKILVLMAVVLVAVYATASSLFVTQAQGVEESLYMPLYEGSYQVDAEDRHDFYMDLNYTMWLDGEVQVIIDGHPYSFMAETFGTVEIADGITVVYNYTEFSIYNSSDRAFIVYGINLLL